MKEIWKDIPQYEGIYQVSNLGKVKRTASGRIIKIKPGTGGYTGVTLHYKAKRTTFAVHRLVAITFLGKPNNYQSLHVHHKNHKRSDNRASNLRWVTPEYNSENKIIDTVRTIVNQNLSPSIALKRLKALFSCA